MTEFLVDANLPEQVLPPGQPKVSLPEKDGVRPTDTEIWPSRESRAGSWSPGIPTFSTVYPCSVRLPRWFGFEVVI